MWEYYPTGEDVRLAYVSATFSEAHVPTIVARLNKQHRSIINQGNNAECNLSSRCYAKAGSRSVLFCHSTCSCGDFVRAVNVQAASAIVLHASVLSLLPQKPFAEHCSPSSSSIMKKRHCVE